MSGATIQFEGTRPENARAIQRLQSADSVSVLLERAGYVDGRVSESGDTIFVEAGARYRLKQLIVRAPQPDTLELNAWFTPGETDNAISAVLARYQKGGYFYAQAEVAEVRAREDEVTLFVNVQPGPVVTVADLAFDGLKQTRASVLKRMLPLQAGDTLTETALQSLARAADEIEFLTYLPPIQIRPLAGYTEAEVVVSFREKKQVRIEGGAGYIPEEPRTVVWDVNLLLRNLLGGGRRVAIDAERRDRGRNWLDLQYQQPFALLGPGRLSARLRTRDYRNDFYEFGVGGGIETDFGDAFTAGIDLGFKRVEPSTAQPGYSRYDAGVSVARRVFDDRLNPMSGLGIGWRLTYSHRRYSEDSLAPRPDQPSLNETRIEVQADVFTPLIGSLVGHLGARYFGLETSEERPPPAELYFIGGPGTLRAFRNEQFLVQRAAIATAEIRWRFEGGYLFPFVDGAYLNQPTPSTNGASETDEFYRVGYGFGVTLFDGLRSVKLSLGWNKDLPVDEPRLSIELATEL